MRAKAECRDKRELKEHYAETTLDPETIEDVRSRWGVKIQSKHRDVTGEYKCQNKRLITYNWKIIDIRHQPKLDKTQILTGIITSFRSDSGLLCLTRIQNVNLLSHCSDFNAGMQGRLWNLCAGAVLCKIKFWKILSNLKSIFVKIIT